ncbi:MAG: T9SS type A sorting domain-containing protein [Saprospiraceae bacterium]|nr:T9SS type A sorting domain-containing protein [Saprospiraceae bacterium]
MTFSRIALLLATLVSGFILQAQTLIPLPGNYPLEQAWWQQETALPEMFRYTGSIVTAKSDCPFFDPSLVYLSAGQTTTIPLAIDTTGLGQEAGNYNCINCGILPGVNAVVQGNELIITPNASIQVQSARILLEFCNPNGCRSQALDILIRRPGRTLEQPAYVLPPEGMIAIDLPLDLPGNLTCTYFLDCPDTYEGRDQVAQVTEEGQLAYRAARYPGTDRLCVVVCDELAVCDTLNFAFDIVRERRTLPFFDDFSYDGPYPDPTLWLDRDPFINDNMALHPPSVGVATFDGLDSRGRPWLPTEHGRADQLTSVPIDLTRGVSSDVWLLFWLQRKGLGDKPEPQDSMILEFKNRNGLWEPIRGFAGIPINQPNTVEEPFNFYRQVLDTRFLHADFQFRFSNYSEGTGVLDNWHLDYVRLDLIQTDSLFDDIAFTQKPQTILQPYTSMPWKHFQEQSNTLLRPDITVGVFNHAVENLNAGPSSASLTEQKSGLSIWSPASPTLFNALESNIPRGEPILRTYALNGDPSGFPSVWSSYLQMMSSNNFDSYPRLEFDLSYQLSNLSQRTGAGYEGVSRNDRVSQTTIFDNYFSYDDGTAEAALVAQERRQVAVRFTTGTTDSLRAVQFHFPHASIDVSDQVFDLRVWIGSLESKPVYEEFGVRPYYTDLFYDTLQGFSTYPLVDENGLNKAVFLPAGTDFFIGWEQYTPCNGLQCIPVGFDKNSPAGKQAIFQNTGSGWAAFPDFFPEGSLMIRAVVGSTTPAFTPVSTNAIDPISELDLFPNPTGGQLYFRLRENQYSEYQYQLWSSVGQLLGQGTLQPELSLDILPTGVYWIKVVHKESGRQLQEKIVLY